MVEKVVIKPDYWNKTINYFVLYRAKLQELQFMYRLQYAPSTDVVSAANMQIIAQNSSPRTVSIHVC
jgi:hypothetical protein